MSGQFAHCGPLPRSHSSGIVKDNLAYIVLGIHHLRRDRSLSSSLLGIQHSSVPPSTWWLAGGPFAGTLWGPGGVCSPLLFFLKTPSSISWVSWHVLLTSYLGAECVCVLCNLPYFHPRRALSRHSFQLQYPSSFPVCGSVVPISSQGCPFLTTSIPSVTLTTEASKSGWGANHNDLSIARHSAPS